MSAKRAALAPLRAAFRLSVLTARPVCEAGLPGCTGRAVDVHEKCRRSQGADLLNADEVLAVCRRCHDWIGDHPAQAVALGLAEWGRDYRRRHRET